MALTLANQCEVHGPTAWASPGSLLEMNNLRAHPIPTESESTFNKIPRWFKCTSLINMHMYTWYVKILSNKNNKVKLYMLYTLFTKVIFWAFMKDLQNASLGYKQNSY